ncbi:fumarylacetoacetase [Halobacteriales archaeon QS_3_64_16]|nr:MAG: fumarylacetoacetase [Halobacteriales archaeon QS_3_64_16]
MRLARARTANGIVEGTVADGTLHAESGTYALGEEATLLAPCEPSALYCVGRNYAATIEQMDYERPEEPDFFLKPPASVHPPGAELAYPSFTSELTYAGELAAVIDRKCHAIDPAAVPDVLRGYTIMNDMDALDQPGRTARKAWNGSAPLGPWIATDVNPAEMAMETTINGETRQEASTAQMLFDPMEVIAFLSERFIFRPGDVIAFGSPANPGLVEPGDEIEIRYEGIGTLETTIGPTDARSD